MVGAVTVPQVAIRMGGEIWERQWLFLTTGMGLNSTVQQGSKIPFGLLSFLAEGNMASQTKCERVYWIAVKNQSYRCGRRL